MIHWIKDKDATFKKVFRNLKPGGQFGFTTQDKAKPVPLISPLARLMGPEKAKVLAEKSKRMYLSVAEYEEMASSNGFEVTSKEVSIRKVEWPNISALLDWWFGVLQGDFDPATIDREALEEFKKQQEGKTFQWELRRLTVVLTKPQCNI